MSFSFSMLFVFALFLQHKETKTFFGLKTLFATPRQLAKYYVALLHTFLILYKITLEKLRRNKQKVFDQCLTFSGPSLALLEVIIWSKFVFSKTPIAKKHYKNRGFSPFFLEKKLRAKILEVIIWSKLAFFKTQSTWTR